MSWDSSSILLDTHNVQGIIQLQTDFLDISFSDWQSTPPNLFPKNLQCGASTSPGVLQCSYDSQKAGESAIKVDQDGNYCCQSKKPYCCSTKGGFNIDCPNDSHILFQKMVSEKNIADCEIPPMGGVPVCTVDAKSTCYKACGKINCESTCSLGNATARCIQGVQNPVPKCPSTCDSAAGNCTSPECFSREGKCGSGDFWQSAGDLENMTKGWIMCEFYYDFKEYDRSRQQNLVSWMLDLFKFQSKNKSSPPPDFSIPMIVNAMAYQTMTIFYNEIYGNTDDSPFSIIPYIAKENELKPYSTNIIAPLLLPLTQSGVAGFVNLPYLESLLLGQMRLPDIWSSGDGLTMTIHPLQLDEMNALSSNDKALKMTSYLRNLLREEFTTFSVINSDGIPQERSTSPCTLESAEITSILLLEVTNVPSSSSLLSRLLLQKDASSTFICNTRTISYDERRNIPPNALVMSYQMSCKIKTYSPMLVAYMESVRKCPASIVPRMYADAGVYPSSYAISSISRLSDAQKDNECRKQIRNPRLAQTVNDLGRLLYGYYSPDCKCAISNIAPITESQFMNKTSMCFDVNCGTPEMVQRYQLTDEVCASPDTCEKVKSWGDFIQNSQVFNQDKYTNLCKSSTRRHKRQDFRIDFVVLLLGLVMTLLTAWILHQQFGRQSHSISNLLLLSITCLICMGIAVFLAFDMYGIPTCVQSPDGKTYTACTSQYSQIQIPSLYCQDRYKWCECLFNTDKCICKSGILVPPSGHVVIQKTQKTEWNMVYGIYVIVIILLSILLTLWTIPTRTIGRTLIVLVLMLIGFLSQYLCFTEYSEYKNNSGC